MGVELIESRIRALAERFIDADEKTGNPEIDKTPTGEVGTVDDEYDEVEDFMIIAQNGAMSASLAIDQMLRRGHKDKLATLFGEEAEGLLKDTLECLKGIVEMMGLSAPESEAPEVDSEKEEMSASDKKAADEEEKVTPDSEA